MRVVCDFYDAFNWKKVTNSQDASTHKGAEGKGREGGRCSLGSSPTPCKQIMDRRAIKVLPS